MNQPALRGFADSSERWRAFPWIALCTFSLWPKTPRAGACRTRRPRCFGRRRRALDFYEDWTWEPGGQVGGGLRVAPSLAWDGSFCTIFTAAIWLFTLLDSFDEFRGNAAALDELDAALVHFGIDEDPFPGTDRALQLAVWLGDLVEIIDLAEYGEDAVNGCLDVPPGSGIETTMVPPLHFAEVYGLRYGFSVPDSTERV